MSGRVPALRVERVEEVDSTNRALLDRARGGEAGGVVLVAGRQTAGRGRLGRTWEAPAGSSLLVSVLLRPAVAPGDAHLATSAAALAAAEACAQVTGVRPSLKWPNDLVVGDRKLAGILTEAIVAGGQLEALVVGMGLNVRWPDPMPGELAGTATSLDRLGRATPSTDDVLHAWLAALAPLLVLLDTAAGRAELASRYRHACATIGRTVRVERSAASGGDVAGTAADVTDGGHLVVVDAAGARHEVSVGDVVHLRPA